MKKVLAVFLVLGSMSAFASSKAEYCKVAQDTNFQEIYRYIQLAAEQTEISEIDKIMKEMAKVEEIQALTAKYCKSK